ncbi:hypothetical protein [Marinobacterium arenosum]|uniref:hypothetical protein n=1 Tax=Marinobacterium arenosum TaxID=2862496 RepID=UPI001C95E049|nr:hypothetical protein [Marinobacterium arenosum]MBY4678850.1 hypothetical protein [Marinobacterium arenosum]
MTTDAYNPMKAPNPEAWLALDEQERIQRVKQFHMAHLEDVPAGSEDMHAMMHVVVENQLAMGEEPVPVTLARLTRQGLDRHDAVHAVAAVLSEQMHELSRGEDSALSLKRFRRRLEKLTAKRWRKGQW